MPQSVTHSDRATQLLADFRTSGQTQAAFCRQRGIPATTLFYYLRRERRNLQSQARLLRVDIAPAPTADPGIAIVLPNGLRIEVARAFDEDLLRRVLATLESR